MGTIVGDDTKKEIIEALLAMIREKSLSGGERLEAIRQLTELSIKWTEK